MTIVDEPAGAASPSSAPPAPSWRVDLRGVSWEDLRPVKWQLYLSCTGLGIGVLMGLLQAFERMGSNLYDETPVLNSYYQGLTLHGVALALIFTFSFSNAFLSLVTMRGYGRPLASRFVSNASLVAAWGGVALAGWAILADKATVLFTFYAPLQATPAFYLGAVLLVVSTWLTLLNQLLTLRAWRREHRSERIPLLSFTATVTSMMWFIASLGIAVEVLGFLLPWSLGWRDAVDPQFTRLLFWFSGHPIVYFWLLPVYVSWYLLLPKQVGSRIYSDGLTRIVFLAFLVLLPVGVHHMFTDPGIAETSKMIQYLLTVALFVPSLATLFTIVAALENAGRARGGKGWLGWIWKLPWSDPSVNAQLLAGLAFMLGGASGLINASYTVNLVVHNTSFIVGHFHLTVGTAVALSIMGICYWMVPYLTGKKLFSPGTAVLQAWTWWIGVMIFARGQMAGGIEGIPRRTQLRDAAYYGDDWDLSSMFTGIGGTLMFIGGVLFFVVLLGTIFGRRPLDEPAEIPVTDVIHGSRQSWAVLDRLGVWAIVAGVLSVVVLGEAIAHYWPLHDISPGIRLW
ncbi:MAG: cbb3-type cytochrome c oxidase subunit I [Acidimicrobiales bacterium]|nr:cbb3-type cytochrome c oxidase subunit I [Acidimicrobiales bacterium]